MKAHVAEDLAQQLAGLFPSATKEEIKFCRERFACYEESSVRICIYNARDLSERLNVSTLLCAIRDRSRTAGRPRQAEIAAELRERDQRIDAEMEQLRKIPANDLAAAVASIVQRQPIFKKCDPERNPVMRALIFQEIEITAGTSGRSN